MPKYAVVTGASAGIGRATAISLSKAGWTVVLSGRREDALKETGGMLTGEWSMVAGDLAEQSAVKALFKHVEDTYGRLDLIFNNAGVSSVKKPLEDIDFSSYRQVMSVNVDAVYMCCQEAIRIMKAQSPPGGRIINNGSISAYTPRPNAAPYTMSKHAILGLTKTIALDYREYHIACSQIDIGNAQSSMTAHKSNGSLQADGSMRSEPIFEASHVGDTVAFLGSLPLEVNILSQTIMATNMPFVGRG